MRILALSAILLAATPAFAAEDLHVRMAKIGANLAGYNYNNYQYCGASPADLSAAKSLAKTKFAAAGAEFDAAFAAGIADSLDKQHTGISQLGEAKYKSSICPNVLKGLHDKLAKG